MQKGSGVTRRGKNGDVHVHSVVYVISPCSDIYNKRRGTYMYGPVSVHVNEEWVNLFSEESKSPLLSASS